MNLACRVVAATSVTIAVSAGHASAQWTFGKSANPSTGPAPLTVVYTYTFDNSHGANPLSSVATPSDINCSPVAFSGGDTYHDQILDVGETWTWTCTAVINATTVNTAQTSAQFTTCQDDVCSVNHVDFITAYATVTTQALAASISGPTSACKGDVVTLTAVATGGTPPYTFSWTTGQTSQAITANTSTAGTFRFGVTVTDSAGHTASANAMLSVAEFCRYEFIPDRLKHPDFPLLTTIEWGCSWSLAGRCLAQTIVRICVGGQCLDNPSSPRPPICPRCDLLASAGAGAAVGFVAGALLLRARRRKPTTTPE
jgi:hypothetical protein